MIQFTWSYFTRTEFELKNENF